MIYFAILIFEEVAQSAQQTEAIPTSWIGFATIVTTIVLGIVRQELQSRRVARKAEETKIEVKEQVSATVEEQKQIAAATVQAQQQIAEEHKEEIKHLIKDNAIVIPAEPMLDPNLNHYESAALWREYIDNKIDRMGTNLGELTKAVRQLDATIQRTQSKQ